MEDRNMIGCSVEKTAVMILYPFLDRDRQVMRQLSDIFDSHPDYVARMCCLEMSGIVPDDPSVIVLLT